MNGPPPVVELHRWVTLLRRLVVNSIVIDRAFEPCLSISGLVLIRPPDALPRVSNRGLLTRLAYDVR
ncbi:MAG TPA: hypothetical protein PKM72_13070 [Nitrospirales bacterium]|nr:hypothetical protein [Nitrospirales bacterium]